MSKIFDALKKADNLRDFGAIEPGLEEPLPHHASSAESTAVMVEETSPALPENGAEPSYAIEPETSHEDGSPRVAGLQVSAFSPVFPFEDLHSQAAEQYRIIRTKILHHANQPRVIVVSSATSGDGKTVTAINLAAVMALKRDAQVLLVDADLRRRDVHKVMGLPEQPGVGDVLSGRCPLDQAVMQLKEFPNLWVLPAGAATQNPAELLESSRWRALMDACRQHFTYVIVDATPVAAVTDFELVQVACDGVILVVRPDHTGRKACMKALEALPKEKLIGTVLNCVEDWFLWRPEGSGYYHPSEG
jgi:capsular exopolysaccharide synthesis family protein